jgi:hypothetical protein
MRGIFEDQGGLFSYIAPEARVPANHPLRKIRALVRDVLGELNRSLGKLYASEGRPSIPPEQLTERAAAPGVLRHPVGTPADGAVSAACPVFRVSSSLTIEGGYHRHARGTHRRKKTADQANQQREDEALGNKQRGEPKAEYNLSEAGA